LVNCWLVDQASGGGVVVEPHLLPPAVRLKEAGWLRRSMLPNGDACWSWSPQARAALHLNALKESLEGRVN
jgi:hypothetical protein